MDTLLEEDGAGPFENSRGGKPLLAETTVC